ncbi:MAG: AMP-binding protein [Planctomycetales bacterium]|nr:AMP-binding protein [Planctomycetales bacterium]
MTPRINIAQTLRDSAVKWPHQRAVVVPAGRESSGRVTYSHLTFEQLDCESDRLARGLRDLGVTPGTRIVLMVRPSLEFIALTFALFKAGAVVVLIDPGMGRTGIFDCLNKVEPQGFVAVPIVQAIRILKRGRFAHAKFNVTVGGRRWFWGGPTYRALLGGEWQPFEIVATAATDPAAIIFTSGSTGPPKGVLYEHGMFAAQVEWLRDYYKIEPGEIDLPGFPLFALFNSAMGVTTVIPDMDPTRPAKVNPERIVEAIHDNRVTQAFGSPAIWNRVGRHCEANGITLPTLRRVLSAGAPVPVQVLERMRKCLVAPDADVFTPYGATESLPVCSISGREVLERTAALTRLGAGTCVGRPFPNIELKIIDITAGPIVSLADAHELPAGEVGEIIVRGAVVTREYYCQPDATRLAKIPDEQSSFWHRMGDVGYLGTDGCLWYCGRKAHIVETPRGRLFTDRCEPIFNEHPRVFRSALVGIGQPPNQQPLIVIEPEPGCFPDTESDSNKFRMELRLLAEANPLTHEIDTILFHRSLPVDVRHNVKIFREKLAPWAAKQLLSPPEVERDRR